MKNIVKCALIVALGIGMVFGTSAVNNADADMSMPKAFLKNVQDKLNKAQTITLTSFEEKGGVKIETKCCLKLHKKGELSCRQEQRPILLAGETPQSLVTIMNHNKIYIFPTGCGNIVVRVKYLETREPDSPLANLFFSEGTFERISEDDADCTIRYTCTPAEVKALKVAIEKKTCAEFQKDMIPAVLEYKISKNSMTLLEMAIYSERGKLITKQLFKDWQFDIDIPDSTFEIPTGFTQYVVRTAKDAEKVQAKLMKVALAEQSKKQQQDKQEKK